MRFGISASPFALGSPAKLVAILRTSGADYLEWASGALMSHDAQLDEVRQAAEGSGLAAEVFTSLLPPHLRVVGTSADHPRALEHAELAFSRMCALGGKAVVFASASARKAPPGFDLCEARSQLVAFLQPLAVLAHDRGLVVALEPVSKLEDNVVTTVMEALELVQRVNHPAMGLVVNAFHMKQQGESWDDIFAARAHIKHVHVADSHRLPPGSVKTDPVDFSGFFGALAEANYDGRCSWEGKSNDLASDAPRVLNYLRAQVER